MYVGWLDIALIVFVGLVAIWEYEKWKTKLEDRMSNIEFDQQELDRRVQMVEHDVASILRALPDEEETIEEQWLRENR